MASNATSPVANTPPAVDSPSSPSNDTLSSPPPPSHPPPSPPPSSPPPSSPPPSSPPPTSPPPPSSKSPPPPKSTSPPPQSSPSPPPPSESSPSPKKSPTPPPDKSPATPAPEGSPPSPPPPAAVSPPPPSTTNSTIPPPVTVISPPSEGSSAAASPPPPPTHRSPPSTDKSSGSSGLSPPTSSSSSSSLSSATVGIIVAATVVGIVILAAAIICLVCAARKKKKKQQFYMDTPGNGPKGEYYNGSNWNTPQQLPPPPGLMGTPSVGIPGWAAPPPPPQAGNTSSEYSSGFSGSHPNQAMRTPSPNVALSMNQSSFSYDELATATNGFSQANLLGQGGFGYVHKGILPHGKEVAVKSLKSGSGQGEREFQAEVEIISRVHHRHLVSLVGYCITDGQRMLVYEFVPNKTLEYHLHGKGQPTMDWATRMRIALGAAKGLGYLHEDCHPRIIHRDIKAANILLDYNFEAMVADFGLAKLTSDNYTHVSTRVMGTFGYMAPEYASSGKLTDKSDVFSFGVMLLELITGRRPIDLTNKSMEDSLVDWARPLLGRALEDGSYEELVDPRLENNYDPHEMDRMISCAASSIRHSARRRPKMTQIVRTLEGDQSSLDDSGDGVKPGQSSTNLEPVAYDTGAYNADMMKFKQMVMSSHDFGTSDFEHTSEYGLDPSASSSESTSREFSQSGMHRQKL